MIRGYHTLWPQTRGPGSRPKVRSRAPWVVTRPGVARSYVFAGRVAAETFARIQFEPGWRVQKASA